MRARGGDFADRALAGEGRAGTYTLVAAVLIYLSIRAMLTG